MNLLSVTGKKWILKNCNYQEVDFIKDNFFLDTITSKLIAIKKIKKEDINNYLNPTIKNILPNPNVLKDMEKTTKRTVQSILNSENIGIFGDYDVDGASSTALLGKYFSEIKQTFNIYIPDRKLEGYGPNKKGFDYLINQNSKIIFTVDCGTLSFETINYAFEKKIDVLVLDHHQSELKLPNAYSVVNPNRFDDNSHLNYLCAAGVCFMFLISLNKELRNINWFGKNNIIEPNLINYLDLASLGTICDVVPLIDLNRAIVKQGLKVLKLRKNLGLKTLLDVCRIENEPTTYDLGYVLGPRINAGGRVGKCSHGAHLLLNENPKTAFKLASELDIYNNQRKIIEKNLLIEILNNIPDSHDPVIIINGANWHEGIIGIIASRIKDKFNKPAIIISTNNNIGKASARSILGFDIGSIIVAAVQKGLLIKGGGHKMAGGFSIETSKIELFKKFVIKKFNTQNSHIVQEKNVMLDSVIAPSAVNIEFFNNVNKLSPFGAGNIEPKFYIEDLKVISTQIVGNDHVKSVLLGKDGTAIKTIAFNASQNNLGAYLLKKNSKTFNIAGKLSLNEWKGKKNVEFIIDDISVNKNNKNTVPSSIG